MSVTELFSTHLIQTLDAKKALLSGDSHMQEQTQKYFKECKTSLLGLAWCCSSVSRGLQKFQLSFCSGSLLTCLGQQQKAWAQPRRGDWRGTPGLQLHLAEPACRRQLRNELIKHLFLSLPLSVTLLSNKENKSHIL